MNKYVNRLVSQASQSIARSRSSITQFKRSANKQIKLQLLNDVSNSLCKEIDSAAICAESKLYSSDCTASFHSIIAAIEGEFSALNSDRFIYNHCLEMLYINERTCPLDIDDPSSSPSFASFTFLCDFFSNSTLLEEKEELRNITSQSESDYFLRSLLADFEARHFMSKSAKQRAALLAIDLRERELLDDIRLIQSTARCSFSIDNPGSSTNTQSTLNSSECLTLLKISDSPSIRSTLFELFTNICSPNEEVLANLRGVRHEKAILLGYRDFQSLQFDLSSRFFTSASMNSLRGFSSQLPFPAQSKIFLQSIINTSLERCHANIDKHLLEIPELPRDYAGLIALRSKLLSSHSSGLTFSWNDFQQLLNHLSREFFDVSFVPRNQASFIQTILEEKGEAIDNDNPPDVKPSVKCFEVFQHETNYLGVVFVDLNGYDSAKTCFAQGYCVVDSEREIIQKPILMVRGNCHLSDTSSAANSKCLSMDNFQMLLHEFGHVLHSMLNKHRYQLVANNFKLDYAEICATLFENLHLLLPQEHLPEPLLGSHSNSVFPSVFRSLGSLEQIYYAKLDLFLADATDSIPLADFNEKLSHNVFRNLINNYQNHWYGHLSHLETYPGLYFAYVFGEHLAHELLAARKDHTSATILPSNDIKSFLSTLFTAAHASPQSPSLMQPFKVND